jgi:hypothetical protein
MTVLKALIENIGQKSSTLYGIEYQMESWWTDVTASVRELNRGGWTGKGADAFYALTRGPMDKQVKDAIQNVMILRKKLDEARDIVKQADAVLTPVNMIEEAIDSIGSWF